jgi:hypothetical protein
VDTWDIIKALDDAIRILLTARRGAVDGSDAIWKKIYHAQESLDKQIKELMKPD